MKFSIRELLLVTVIVALTAGWWVDHRRSAAEVAKEREFRSRLHPVPRYGNADGKNWKQLWGEPWPIGDY